MDKSYELMEPEIIEVINDLETACGELAEFMLEALSASYAAINLLSYIDDMEHLINECKRQKINYDRVYLKLEEMQLDA